MKEIKRKMNTNNFHRFTKITQYKIIIIIKYFFLVCLVFLLCFVVFSVLVKT